MSLCGRKIASMALILLSCASSTSRRRLLHWPVGGRGTRRTELSCHRHPAKASLDSQQPANSQLREQAPPKAAELSGQATANPELVDDMLIT